MYYVYILKSEKDGKLYIGFSNNLKNRLEKHKNKKVKSTSYRNPLKLVYYEAYQSKKDAQEREKQLKYFGKAYSQLKKRIKDSYKT